VFIITPIFDVQSDLLGIIGQEAVAHAALIFASLTATFAFATGFKKQVKDRAGKVIYVGFLGPLVGIAVYAFFRMYLWGTLLGAVLNNPPDVALTKCKPLPPLPVGSLSFYWNCVNTITSNTLDLNFITAPTLSTFFFSLGLGFLISIGLLVLVLSPDERKSAKCPLRITVVLLLLGLIAIAIASLCYYPHQPHWFTV
jgi:hypothetical protein